MKIFIRIITLTLVVVFVMSLSVCAYADTYDLSNGLITVDCNDAGVQQVSQPANSINEHPDPNPVITGQLSENAIAAEIDASNGDVNVTFENISLTDALIYVGGDNTDHTATLTFMGNNTINNCQDKGMILGGVNTVTVQGSDDSATLDILGSPQVDEDEKSIGIGGAFNNLIIKDVNLNIIGTDIGILCEEDSAGNIEITNSNVTFDCREFTICLCEEESVPSLEKCADQIIENSHVDMISGYSMYGSDWDFWTIFGEDDEPAIHATIRRPITVQPSKNTSDTDDIGVHESNAFSFNTGLRHLIQIICNGDVLEEGKDYIIDIVDGMEIIKFTEEFFLKYGDGPVPVCVEYTDMIYNLSAINTK